VTSYLFRSKTNARRHGDYLDCSQGAAKFAAILEDAGGALANIATVVKACQAVSSEIILPSLFPPLRSKAWWPTMMIRAPISTSIVPPTCYGA
jgi:hypothetical protein